MATCPSCNGPGGILGDLGRMRHYRCRNCGWQWSRMLKPKRPAKKLTLLPGDAHQLRVAYDTLRMSDAMAGVMGGMSKAEAREVIKRLTGKEPPK